MMPAIGKDSGYARSLIEASLDPLITISTHGKITDMNEALAGITGLSRQELTGTDFFDYFTEPEKAREVYQEVFAKGSVSDSPLTVCHKNGKLTAVLFNGSVYKNDAGQVMGIVIVARDVTSQKRIARELVEAKVFAELTTIIAEEAKMNAETATKIAENAVVAKQQFLSNMSHEIRTPMNAIIGFTRVLQRTDLSERQRDYLQAIKLSGDSLIVLINDILDLAKVDAGKMTFEKTPFKLAASISSMLHVFEAKIQEKNLLLVHEYDDRIPAVLVGDPTRLHQVILNLLSNAVKFTSEGSITVKVKLLEEKVDTATVKFSVTDTGIGIAEDKVSSIFENFQQASSDTTRLYGGTGLGLAIVKQLIEPQGGKVVVESKMGVGTTFSFTLEFEKTAAEAGIEDSIIEIDREIKNIRVLVVEDIKLNQLLMKTLLDDFGFEWDIAQNGQVAIDKLKVKSYDLILMDLQMPVMNGFETTRYIRNVLKSPVPIIALTADVTTMDLQKCTAVGMNDYVAKPVDEKTLYSKILGQLKKIAEVQGVSLKSNGNGHAKHIDLTFLQNLTKGDPALILQMVNLFLEQTPSLITQLKHQSLKKEYKLVQATVHKMIPSFSIMGITSEIEVIARQIQEYSGGLAHLDRIHNLVLALERVCLKACTEAKEEVKNIKELST